MKTTKQLARELGLLRKRSSSSASLTRIKKTCQFFSYLIVIDFESTCWQDGKHRSQEIIEFPAVLLNTATGEIESEFQYYIQPHENPVLSEFCKQLTGISQDQVEQGIPLSICLRKFSQWLKQIREEKSFVYNTSDDPVQKKCTFVTWSDWDLSVCLQYEAQRKQLRKPQELNSWLDLRATYRKFYDRRPNGLNGALQDLGINFEGRQHSGLDDARNTARLAYRMMCDGCVMVITKTLTPSFAVGNPVRVNNNRNAILNPPAQSITSVPKASANNICDKPSPFSKSSNFTSQNKDVSNDQRNSKDGEIKTKPAYKSSPGVIYTNLKSNNGHAVVCTSTENANKLVGSIHNNALKSNNTTIEQSRKFDIYQDKSNSTTPIQSNVTGAKLGAHTFRDVTNNALPQKTSFTSYKTPSPHMKIESQPNITNKFVLNNNNTNKSTTSAYVKTSSHNDQNSTLGSVCNKFKTPSPVNIQHNNTNRPGSALSWSYKTPSPIFNTSSNKSFVNSSYMKKTPPLCQCGRRTSRKFVQSPGPNEGRAFYCCPLGRSGHSSGSGLKKTGCGYFLWESKFTSPQLQLNRNSLLCANKTNSIVSCTKLLKNVVAAKSPSESNLCGFSVSSPLLQPNFDTPDSNRIQSVINPLFKK